MNRNPTSEMEDESATTLLPWPPSLILNLTESLIFRSVRLHVDGHVLLLLFFGVFLPLPRSVEPN